MKQKEKFWVSASRIMQITGLDKYEMARLREKNPGWWEQEGKRYKYDLNCIRESMIIKKLVA